MFDMVAGDQAVCFGVTFENGWRLSVSFVDGPLTKNTNKEIERYKLGSDIITTVEHEVYTVEVMVKHTVTKQIYTQLMSKYYTDDDVRCNVMSDEVVEMMAEVKALLDPTKQGV